MNDADKQKVMKAQSEAWSSLRTYASLASNEFKALPESMKRQLLNIDFLLEIIEKKKASLDKLIDSIPD